MPTDRASSAGSARQFQEQVFGVCVRARLSLKFVERARCDVAPVFQDDDAIANRLRLLEHMRAISTATPCERRLRMISRSSRWPADRAPPSARPEHYRRCRQHRGRNERFLPHPFGERGAQRVALPGKRESLQQRFGARLPSVGESAVFATNNMCSQTGQQDTRRASPE